MASSVPVDTNSSQAKRKRKANFSSAELAVLVDKFEESKDVLVSKLTNQVTNNRKKAIWKEITNAVNAIGYECTCRCESEIKEKWKNLKSGAKKSVASDIREARKTGGGRVTDSHVEKEFGSSSIRDKICDMFQDSASFVGIEGGLETEIGSGNCATVDLPTEEEVVSLQSQYVTINTEELREVVEAPTPALSQPVPELPAHSTPDYTPIPSTSFSQFVHTAPPPCLSRPTSDRPRLTQQDIWQMQYRVLLAQEKNLELQNTKIKLEIEALQEKKQQQNTVCGLWN